MKILDLIRLKPKKKSAHLAKERLQIIINHERISTETQDFLPQLRKELVAVLSKYVQLDEDHINIQMTKDNNQSIIEMNVVVPTSESSVTAGSKTNSKSKQAEPVAVE